ncbi:hypothetical protein D3C84_1128880 [compost metagenome]
MQTLTGGNHSGGEIGRQLTGARFGREIAFVFVVVDLGIGEGVEAAVGFGFTGRPKTAQAVAGRGETFNA